MPNTKFTLDGARELLRNVKNSLPFLWGPQLKKPECGTDLYLLSCKYARWDYPAHFGGYSATVKQCNKCEKIFSSTNLMNRYDDKLLTLQMAGVQS